MMPSYGAQTPGASRPGTAAEYRERETGGKGGGEARN